MTHRFRRRLALVAASLVPLAGACDRASDSRTDMPPPAEAAGDHGGEPHAHDEGHGGDHHEHSDPPTSLADLPEGINAVQHEMRLLDDAMRTTLSLLANADLDAIPAEILRVHPARQITQEAIEAGAYQPPERPEDLAEFQVLDDAFHDDLKALIDAAERDDLNAATEAYADLIRGCTTCHQSFRF